MISNTQILPLGDRMNKETPEKKQTISNEKYVRMHLKGI